MYDRHIVNLTAAAQTTYYYTLSARRVGPLPENQG